MLRDTGFNVALFLLIGYLVYINDWVKEQKKEEERSYIFFINRGITDKAISYDYFSPSKNGGSSANDGDGKQNDQGGLPKNNTSAHKDNDTINNNNKDKYGQAEIEEFNRKFQEKMMKYETMKFKDVLMLFANNFTNLNTVSEDQRYEFLSAITTFVVREPIIPINETCHKNDTLNLISQKCDDYTSVFSGARDRQVKIAHLIQFGFETDVLEIHLNEIYDEVDKFFIVEASRSHFMNSPKPLVWPILAKQKRFQRFLDKVVYIVITDEMLSKFPPSNSIWRNEGIQENLRWELFLKWNEQHNNYFTDEDLIGFGDTDEIASYQNLRLLKNCQALGTTDIGAWFTFGQINKFFYSDFPVSGHRNTLGDPTYHPFANAKKVKTPSRNRGKSPYHLLGGIHLTRYRYLPSLLLKDITQTEASKDFSLFKKILKLLEEKKNIHEVVLQVLRDNEASWDGRKYHNLNKEELGKVPYIIPWFLGCNLNRYSTFLVNPIPDARLE